jgi:hypothetical protein
LLKAAVHEFAHCVHYQYMDRLQQTELARVSGRAEAPWLFEAMASYAASQFYPPDKFSYMTSGNYPDLRTLNNVEENGYAYDLGFVIIEFVKTTWGHTALLHLLRTNGDVMAALQVDERTFEAALYRYVREHYLRP